MTPPDTARSLFAPLAADYERWAAVLSMGQDRRWRTAMVENLGLPSGSLVLDLAAGTGSITRLLTTHGHRVVAADQSPEMLDRHRGGTSATLVRATAASLPFPARTFDGVTFGYLLRYVVSVPATLSEIARVCRPGGVAAMVEFGRPRGRWSLPWLLYTRGFLPLAGRAIGPGWHAVGRFLGPSISDFDRQWPRDRLVEAWRRAGFDQVEVRPMSLGGGTVAWGHRRDD